MIETANYSAHLSNLESLLAQAKAGHDAGELALAAAQATCVRTEYTLSAALRTAAALYRHDFGTPHGANADAVCEALERQLAAARAARRIARESLATNGHVVELITRAAQAFRDDHGQLAEAHAAAPHAAKTREAYQPM